MFKKFFKTVFNVRPDVGDKVTTFIGLDMNEVTGVVSRVIGSDERGQGGYCWIDIFNKKGRYLRSVTASFSYCWFNYI